MKTTNFDDSKVEPGDIITADFMNRVLDRIQKLEKKVKNLPDGGASSGQLTIKSVLPSRELTVGQEAQLVGENFGRPSDNSVFISRMEADISAGKSGATRLVFTVPPISGLPAGGSPETVRVVNQNTGVDDASVTIKPAESDVLTGSLTFTYTGPVRQTKLTPGDTFGFTFKLTAETTQGASYRVSPTIPQQNYTAEVLNEQDKPVSSRQIRIPQSPSGSPFEKTFTVEVTIPSSASPGDTFRPSLQIQALSNSNFTGQGSTQLTVDETPEPPSTDVQVVFTGVVNGTEANGVLEIRPSPVATVEYRIEVEQDGTYDITHSIDSDKWTIDPTERTGRSIGTNNPLSEGGLIKPDSDTSPDATLTIKAKGVGGDASGKEGSTTLAVTAVSAN
jgi:hypothetical protein